MPRMRLGVTALFLLLVLWGRSQPTFEYLFDYSFSHIRTVHFANDNLGIIGELDKFKITTDGGRTWWTRTIPNFNPSQLKISVQGSDTLIIAMELRNRKFYVFPERNRVLVFHGVKSQPQEIYNTDFTYALVNTSLTIRDSSIFLGGIFADSSDIHPVTGSYTPYVMISHDHGHSWSNKKAPLTPSKYKSLYDVTYFSKDTLIITWYDFQQFYSRAYANDLQVLIPGDEINGRILDCRNRLNLIESNDNELQVLQGYDGSFAKIAVNDWCDVYGYKVRFIDDLEFLTDGFRLCDGTFPMSNNLSVFTIDPTQTGNNVLIDTNLYDFRSGLPGPLFNEYDNQISLTENYVYMLRAPYIIKFSRHQLSYPEVYNLTNNVSVGYTPDFTSLVIGGLEDNTEYTASFYTIGGLQTSKSISISSHFNVCSMDGLTDGVYLLHLEDQGTGSSMIYKVMKR